MTEGLNASKIYKRLAGGQKKPIGNIIWYVLGGVLIYLATAFILLSVTRIKLHYHARLSFSLAFIFVVPIYVWYAKKQIKLAARKIQKRHAMIEAMSEMEFYKLDSQIMESKYYFKTFYFLEEYMYVPRYRLLIKYTDIISLTNRIRRTGKGGWLEIGAYLEVIDNDGLHYKINVKQWDNYLKHRETVREILIDKMTMRNRTKIRI